MRPILPLPAPMNLQDGSLWPINHAMTRQNLRRPAPPRPPHPFQPRLAGPPDSARPSRPQPFQPA